MAAAKTRIWRGGLEQLLKGTPTPDGSEPPKPDVPEAAPAPAQGGAAVSSTHVLARERTRADTQGAPDRSRQNARTLLLTSMDLFPSRPTTAKREEGRRAPADEITAPHEALPAPVDALEGALRSTSVQRVERVGAPEAVPDLSDAATGPSAPGSRAMASTRVLPIEQMLAQVEPVGAGSVSAVSATQGGRAAHVPSAPARARSLPWRKLARPVLYVMLTSAAGTVLYMNATKPQRAPAVAHTMARPVPAVPGTPPPPRSIEASAQPATDVAPHAAPSERDDDGPAARHQRRARRRGGAVAASLSEDASAASLPKRLERDAVDALASGDYLRARALYEQLARARPADAAFGETLRILSARGGSTP